MLTRSKCDLKGRWMDAKMVQHKYTKSPPKRIPWQWRMMLNYTPFRYKLYPISSLFQMATDLMNPVQCRKCDNPAAKFHCNTCGHALCPSCKVNHSKTRGTRHHDVVPYAQKLNPKYLSDLLCYTHKTDAPEYWCDTCEVPICSSCITEQHKGHEISKITTILSTLGDFIWYQSTFNSN